MDALGSRLYTKAVLKAVLGFATGKRQDPFALYSNLRLVPCFCFSHIAKISSGTLDKLDQKALDQEGFNYLENRSKTSTF